MKEGLYESLVTTGLVNDLAEVSHLETELAGVDSADAPHVLSRHIAEAAQRALTSVKSPEQRLALTNALLAQLDSLDDVVQDPPTQLLRLAPPVGPGQGALSIARPATPLSDAALLTNAHGEPNLGAELRAELETCDEVDLLCAFVKWHGLRSSSRSSVVCVIVARPSA